ncbi:MAG TPA: AAA family ATPase, partial [Mycobacteriales bacterium]|nr:AAA family ATPase [Mycobacteriales bacterium]
MTPSPGPADDDRAQARAFADDFRRFLDWLHAGEGGRQNEVTGLLRRHLGPASGTTSVVSRGFAPFDHVNLQVALDAWAAEPGRAVDVSGLSRPPHFGPLDLSMLVHGDHLPPVRLSAPDLVDLAVGPDRTLACLQLALLRVTDTRGRYVLLVRGPQPHEDPRLVVEVTGLPTADAQDVLRELADLRRRLNVYRGQLLELQVGPGGVAVAFPQLAPTGRDDVVLPESVLRRVERHTLDMAARRDDLRAAGQHLKRGLLLHGPPGTGKTHTTRYVVQHLPGTTVLLLSGRSLHLVGEVTQLARDLQPAV